MFDLLCGSLCCRHWLFLAILPIFSKLENIDCFVLEICYFLLMKICLNNEIRVWVKELLISRNLFNPISLEICLTQNPWKFSIIHQWEKILLKFFQPTSKIKWKPIYEQIKWLRWLPRENSVLKLLRNSYFWEKLNKSNLNCCRHANVLQWWDVTLLDLEESG